LHLFSLQCRWNMEISVTVWWQCCKFYRRLATNWTSLAYCTCTDCSCMRLFCHQLPPERPEWYIHNGPWEAVRGSHWERPVWASPSLTKPREHWLRITSWAFLCEVAKPFFPRSMYIRCTKRVTISGWLVPFSWTWAAVNYSAFILWLKRSYMLAVCLRHK